MMKMSKLRISSNDKRGHLRKHSNKLLKKQRDVNWEYHDDKSFKNIKTTKVLFEKALK